MKIDVDKIPFEGITLEEEIPASALELDSEAAKYSEPVKVEADISRITNAVTVELTLSARLSFECSRCLEEVRFQVNKRSRLNYQVDKLTHTIDLNPDIREEIMLDYPVKPLCAPACKGLCLVCGKNLNKGACAHSS